jgi:hypothetical protein
MCHGQVLAFFDLASDGAAEFRCDRDKPAVNFPDRGRIMIWKE